MFAIPIDEISIFVSRRKIVRMELQTWNLLNISELILISLKCNRFKLKSMNEKEHNVYLFFVVEIV